MANPVNPQNGSKLEFAIDFVGNGAFPLKFMRSYRSSGTVYPVGIVREGGAMGKVWRHNYERDVVVDGDTGNTAIVIRPNGYYAHFKKSGSTWVGDNDDASTLTELKNGSGVRIGWEFGELDDSKESFDANGRFTSVTNRASHVQTLSYDGNARLTTITDENGRAITLTYNANGLVSQATLPDGNVIAYGYGDSGLSDGQVGGVHYDLADRLETVTYPGGAERIYLYNEPGKTSAGSSSVVEQVWAMTGILDENGDRYGNYEWYANGRVKISEHAGGADRHQFTYATWLGDGDTTVVDPLGTSKVYHHVTAAGAVRSEGVTIPCPSCGGTRTQTKTYDSNGYRDLITDFRGVTTNYDHNTRGLETQRIDISNTTCPTGLTGCTAHKRTLQTDWHSTLRVPTERRIRNAATTLESVARYAYNARGQQTAACQVEPTNSTAMAYTCGASTSPPTGVRQTRTDYCDTTDGDYGAAACPRQGLVKNIDGPRTDVSDITTLTYRDADHSSCASAPTTCPYRKGDLWIAENAAGHETEILAYDGAGRVLSVLDANGIVTDMEYTPRGWLSRRLVRGTNGSSEADDAITTFAYEGYGAINQVTQPDGSELNYYYDDAHRLIAVSDGAGDRIDYTLDAAGNRTKEQTKDAGNNLKRLLSRQHDALGRLSAQFNAAYAISQGSGDPATRIVYDANGNTDTINDPLGVVTDNAYDALNRLVQTIGDQGNSKINATSAFTYDARDNLRTVADPKGLVTTYTYDAHDNQTQLQSPDTGTTGYTYDKAGNRITQTDARNITATYAYDDLNRVAGISYPTSAKNVAFDYDTAPAGCQSGEQFSVGRLAGYTDESGSTELCYDRFGRLVRKTIRIGANTYETTWAHDAAGHVLHMGYPSGTEVDYTRDGQGRIIGVEVTPAGGSPTTIVSDVDYLPFGPISKITWGNAETMMRLYDQNYWIDQIDSTANGLDLEFGTDDAGNITALSDSLAATPPDNTYHYDRLHRLIEAEDSAAATVEAYTYDATGNRTSKQIGAGSSQSYVYPTTTPNSHKLLSVGGVTRNYDANGNTTSRDGTEVIAYDDRSRMTGYNDGTQFTYLYNARGERVRKSASGVAVEFVYSSSGKLIAETDTVGADTRDIIWLDNLPIATFEPSTGLQAIEPDHAGSPRQLVDLSTDDVLWRWSILANPFGEQPADEDPDADSNFIKFNLRFPGHYADAESGLTYNYFRSYETGTGRYVESDPIGLGAGWSTFAYVDSTPLTAIDVFGLCKLSLGDGPPTTDHNTIVCYDELPGVYAPSGSDSPDCPALDQCLIEHEDEHLNQCGGNNPCGGNSGITQIQIEGSHQEFMQCESGAMDRELRCLNDARDDQQRQQPLQCKNSPSSCCGMIDDRIDEIQNCLLDAVNAGTYPLKNPKKPECHYLFNADEE